MIGAEAAPDSGYITRNLRGTCESMMRNRKRRRGSALCAILSTRLTAGLQACNDAVQPDTEIGMHFT
jgi:hypothetical protein